MKLKSPKFIFITSCLLSVLTSVTAVTVISCKTTTTNQPTKSDVSLQKNQTIIPTKDNDKLGINLQLSTPLSQDTTFELSIVCTCQNNEKHYKTKLNAKANTTNLNFIFSNIDLNLKYNLKNLNEIKNNQALPIDLPINLTSQLLYLRTKEENQNNKEVKVTKEEKQNNNKEVKVTKQEKQENEGKTTKLIKKEAESPTKNTTDLSSKNNIDNRQETLTQEPDPYTQPTLILKEQNIQLANNTNQSKLTLSYGGFDKNKYNHKTPLLILTTDNQNSEEQEIIRSTNYILNEEEKEISFIFENLAENKNYKIKDGLLLGEQNSSLNSQEEHKFAFNHNLNEKQFKVVKIQPPHNILKSDESKNKVTITKQVENKQEENKATVNFILTNTESQMTNLNDKYLKVDVLTWIRRHDGKYESYSDSNSLIDSQENIIKKDNQIFVKITENKASININFPPGHFGNQQDQQTSKIIIKVYGLYDNNQKRDESVRLNYENTSHVIDFEHNLYFDVVS